MKNLRLSEEELRDIERRIKRSGSATVTTKRISPPMRGVDIDAVHKNPKYGNRKTEVSGIVFHSKREADRYGELKLLQSAGEISGLDRQVIFELKVNDVHVCRYVADFVYRDKIGARVVEDAKGYRTEVFKLKKKLMLACHGIAVIET